MKVFIANPVEGRVDGFFRRLFRISTRDDAKWRSRELELEVDQGKKGIPSTPAPEEAIPQLSKLKMVDTIFIFDDSWSMTKRDIPTEDFERTGVYLSRWRCLVQAVQHFAPLAARFDTDGIDVHFIINRHLERDTQGIEAGEGVLKLLKTLQGIKLTKTKSTPLNAVLREVLGDYVTHYHDWFTRHSAHPEDDSTPTPKPINVIVLTDGATEDHQRVEDTLVRVARAMADMDAAPRQVGVQFVQIGAEEDTTSWLRTLDDNLRDMHGVRDVSTTRERERSEVK